MSDVGTIHHRFPSLKADLADATKVRPGNWNDSLILAGGVNGQVLVRDTLQADGWGWALPTDLAGLVPATRQVNGHALSADVTVTKSDIGLGNVENTALSTGNAGSATLAAAATILATARAINGVNFDGSAPITVPAAAGTLTGTTFSAGVLGANQNWTAQQTFGLGATVNGGALTIAGAGEQIWTGRSILNAVQNGQLRLRNNARSIGVILKFDALPTVASGFGTSPAITAGSTPLAGSVNVGTGGIATAGVIDFNGTAFATAPFAIAMNTTTGAIVRATATTTQLTITALVAFAASDVIAWICIGPH